MEPINEEIIEQVSELAGLSKEKLEDYLLHLHEVEHCKFSDFWNYHSSCFGFSVLCTENNHEAVENEIQRVVRRLNAEVGKRFGVSYKKYSTAVFVIGFLD